ncbi:alpha/beta hydrolase family protein [Roseibium sp. Sym1]|uniref:alpha/beta hydrolase family protein n=1 Tax=Roseibium sp. Sym1 TaxID=3016006 RepID=UPI0022B41954|nr:alpha/beta fold hydrolase [Roseibium sp. Sym1]
MKRRRVLVWTGTAFLVVLALLALAFPGLRDFDLSEYRTRPLSFFFDDATVAGTLHSPETDNPPVVLLVHGDGPADRYSGGAYMPLISTLLDSGIAVYSWDKPGVGESSGDWLSFSMEDRSRLASTALDTVKSQPEFRSSPIGFVGFSQGGWVVPILAEAPAKADFFVIIGGAVNWLRQGRYYTKRRLELAGADIKTVEATLADAEAGNRKLLSAGYSYASYLSDHTIGIPMSESRFAFVRRNALADSSASLQRISAPILTLHGSGDLNVDPAYNSGHYRDFLEGRNDANRFLVIPDGSHALLRTALFNQQRDGDMPAWTKLAFALLGRKAYAPGALDTLTGWILERARKAG